ncbi:GNAT family N-acetyltransferase [Salinarimonas rosea]|uniref:GNAT family N-acetyltransferase n=1 Tax=Salinarimonas rosea TaxID=552063 RepID=UPI000414F8A1|nr:GNAT family N-acetyltransferase [Salinarimonas rosea]
MRLRPATSADLPTLRAWDDDPDIAASSGADDAYDWAAEIPRVVDWREILIFEAQGRPVGVLVSIDPAREESHYWGDCGPGLRALDVWIGAASDRGRGFGAAMMRLALERCFADPSVTAVLLDPLAENVRACRFYERLGFRAVERRLFGEDDCVVYRLEREAWENASPSP